MRKGLTILFLFAILAAQAKEKETTHLAWDSTYSFKKLAWSDKGSHYETLKIGRWCDSLHTYNGTKYFEYYADGTDDPILFKFWTVYSWNTTSTSISITNATFGTLLAGDIVNINARSGGVGYRSISVLGLGVETMAADILIQMTAGAYIAGNAGGNLFANTWDNNRHVRLRGINMSNHTDPLFFTHFTTDRSSFITFDSITLHNMPGIFGSGPQTPTGVADFGGTVADTVNCWYKIVFNKIDADSIGNTTNGGLTTLFIGSLSKKDVWLNVEVKNSNFHYNPSPTGSGAACHIHAQNCFYLLNHDNVFADLGVVAHPQGHAASEFVQASLTYTYNNIYKRNFANCERVISSASLQGMTSLFLSWDPNYDGVGRFYNNILDSGYKYPMIECQKDTIGMNGLTYMTPRRSPRIWNCTMYRGGSGANGNGPYNVASDDWYFVTYTVDTLEIHNCLQVGPPTDTVATMCGSQACNAFITRPNNGTPFYDTSGNLFWQAMTFATSGLLDTTTFRPIPGGILSGGVATPAWLTTDYYGNPYGATHYTGAVNYVAAINPSGRIRIFIRKTVKAK